MEATESQENDVDMPDSQKEQVSKLCFFLYLKNLHYSIQLYLNYREIL